MNTYLIRDDLFDTFEYVKFKTGDRMKYTLTAKNNTYNIHLSKGRYTSLKVQFGGDGSINCNTYDSYKKTTSLNSSTCSIETYDKILEIIRFNELNLTTAVKIANELSF